MNKSAVIATGLIVGLFAIEGRADVKLVQKTFLDGKLRLHVPQSFKQLNQLELDSKYPKDQRPTTAVVNSEDTVHVLINHTQRPLEPSQTGQAHLFFESMFRKSFPSAKWGQSEVITVGERQLFMMDLRTAVKDSKIRNILLGTSLEGRLLLVTFDCTQDIEKTWGVIGRRILASAVITPGGSVEESKP